MSDTVPGVLAQVKSGKLRAIGVAIPKRSPFLPDVPTLAEQGYPGFESVGWIGLAAPAKTPAAILDQLNAEIRKMLQDPAVKARFEQLAFTTVGDSRERVHRVREGRDREVVEGREGQRRESRLINGVRLQLSQFASLSKLTQLESDPIYA